MSELKFKIMNKEIFESSLKSHEFIGKVYQNHIQANHVAINKAFAHPDYGFRTVILDEGFAVVGKKRSIKSYALREATVKVDKEILRGFLQNL